MIRYFGVVAYGVPVIVEGVDEAKEDFVVSGVIETISVYMETMELGSVSTIAAGDYHIYIAKTKKNYIVFAVSEYKNRFFSDILLTIVREIDAESDIPSASGFVDESLAEAIGLVLRKYLARNVHVDDTAVSDFLLEVLGKLNKNKFYVDMFRELDREISKFKEDLEELWRLKFDIIEGSHNEAINYALEGDFSFSSALIMRSTEDPKLNALAIRFGSLANLITNILVPPISVLERLSDILGEGDVYIELAKATPKYYLGKIDRKEYVSLYNEALKNFDKESPEAKINSLILFDFELIGSLGEEELLLEYYKEESEVLYNYIKLCKKKLQVDALFKSGNTEELLRNMGVFASEFLDEAAEAEKVVRIPREIIRRGRKTNKTIINFSSLADAYLSIALKIMNFCEIDTKTKFEIIGRLYDRVKHILKIVDGGFPILLKIPIIENLATILGMALDIYPSAVLPAIVENIKKLAKNGIRILIEKNDIAKQVLSGVVSVYSLISNANLQLKNEPIMESKILYILSKVINMDMLREMRDADKEMYIEFIKNIVMGTLPIFIRTGEKDVWDKARSWILFLLDIAKYLFREGKKDLLILKNVCLYLMELLDVAPKNEILELTQMVMDLYKPIIQNTKHNGLEFVILSQNLIKLLSEISKKFGEEKLQEEASRMLNTAKKILLDIGMNKKASELDMILREGVEETITELL